MMKTKHNNITLIGMPASGKSSIGVVLAKRLGMQFIDVDLVIQEKTGMLLKEIIAKHGDEGFRKIEDDINAQLNCAECRYCSRRKCDLWREGDEAFEKN